MKRLSPDELARIRQAAIRELGAGAPEQQIQELVNAVVDEMERGAPSITLGTSFPPSADSGKVIITAFGKNRPGILYQISKTLFELSMDVQDVSQKIMQDFFTLIMIVDQTTSPADFAQMKSRLNQTADELGIRIFVQHEDIFKSMHRV